MSQKPTPEGGCLYAFGKGTVYALLVFTIPCLFVVWYYDDIKARVDGIAALPVFHEMTRDFRTGFELAGGQFKEHLAAFYADSSLQSKPPTFNKQKKSYWDRQAIEKGLTNRMSKGYHRNIQAYLDYIDRYRELATDEMQRTKIPASITLAQGLLETDAGRSILCQKGNNHFGIKCKARAGFKRDGRITDGDFNAHSLAVDCMQMTDDYAWDRFEVYNTPAHSFRRHSLLLQDSRYGWMLRKYEIGGLYTIPKKLYGHQEVPYYAAWAVGLKSSGYATARTYAEKITLIIETYQLWKIDYELIAT
ncbi:MAG: glucosaminidase domain-containing protein [Saprospiraceae bacterium]|nr:glucosaminidase domain-containing protein [Saprospiraceae bacterium]